MPKTLNLARVSAVFVALATLAALVAGGVPERAGAQSGDAPDVEGDAWALADADSGRVLAGENRDEQISVASTTKIMSALVVLESDVNLDEEVTVTDTAEEYVGGPYSNVGLISGETVTVRDLLAASLIPSGTDAVYALAEYVGDGSVEQFVEQMNRRSDELGMENTNFTNPAGLDEEQNYSSAADLLTVSSEAMKDDLFRELVAQPEATIQTRGVEDRQIDVFNTNELLISYPGATGIKTGTSAEDGYMLVSSAEAQDESYLAAVLGTDSSATRFTASEELLRYAFASFEQRPLVEEGQVYAEKEIPFRGRSVQLTAADTISSTVEDGADVERRIRGGDLPDSASEGDEVGQVEVLVDGESVGTSALLAAEGYEEAPWWQKITGRVTGWVSGLFG